MEKNVKRVLQVKLSKNEVVERGQLAADIAAQIDQAEIEKKQFSDRIKERLLTLEGELRRLLYIVKAEQEPRTVECYWKFDFMKNEKSLVREDTFEVIQTEAMTDAERQIALQMEEKPEERTIAHA